MPGLRIQVFEKGQVVHAAECPEGPVELGRQAEGESAPYQTRQENGRWRVVFARLDETVVSRRHLSVEALPDGKVRLTNLSRITPVQLVEGGELTAGASREVLIPAFLVLGERHFGIQPLETAPVPLPSVSEALSKPNLRIADGEPPTPLHSLAEATIPPGGGRIGSRNRIPPSPGSAEGMQTDALVRWLQTAMDVLQSAAGSSDFFDKAAHALVEMVGLDSGQVLLLDNGKWKVQARQSASHSARGEEAQASRHALAKVLGEKRTFWEVPTSESGGSLLGINALVVAPILEKNGNVLGALYGDRQTRGFSAGLPPITKLQAMLVELLATGVAAGLARIEQEQALLQRQKRFLQYEKELEIGRQIQIGFLPEELPQAAGWEIAAHFQPAREVAGDFYDVFPLSSRHLGLVMADVCDKGVGAALFMALFRSLIRAFSQQTLSLMSMGLEGEGDPKTGSKAGKRLTSMLVDLTALSTVELTNKYVTTTHAKACMFVTLFFGILDTTTGLLTYVNGGHDAPIILGPGGVKARLETTGPVVGLMADSDFDIANVTLEPGDVLIAYTDGIPDARNPAGKSFTEKKLLAILEAPAPTAASFLERVVASLRDHIADADQFDDITILGVRSRVGLKSGPAKTATESR